MQSEPSVTPKAEGHERPLASLCPTQCGLNFLVRVLQRLRQDTALSGYGYEIRVPNPTWQDMHMDVRRDSGSSGSANIHADVDPFGRIDSPQHTFHRLAQRHCLVRRSFG